VRFLRGGLFFPLREVDLQQDEILVRVLLELGLGEDFAIELDAPAAPVRAGEVN
jgi:hypothetical protein